MAQAATRREPTIVPPISLDAPSPPVQPSAAGQSEPSANEESAPAVHTAEGRQKLKAALDELVACRQIIETALAQG